MKEKKRETKRKRVREQHVLEKTGLKAEKKAQLDNVNELSPST